MLSNIIGTLLAFVAIMLMLSLLITSLVQFTQASLRLRGRNLLFGVGALLKQHVPEAKALVKTSALRADSHRALAARVLNATDASLKRLPEPNASTRVVIGPPVSWVKPEDLARAVMDTVPSSSAVAEPTGAAATPPAATIAASMSDVQTTFENMEPALAKRFQFIMRIWTVVWSVVIAVAFQVSTPDLLKTLPSADAKRQAILAAVPNLTNDATRKMAFATGNILEAAIARRAEEFPKCRDLFDEVSGESDSRQAMMNEMRAVLKSCPDRQAVLSEYSSIIDRLSQSVAESGYADASKRIDELNSFGITMKLNNFDFYAGGAGKKWYQAVHWNNILGVLITAILLSLGAPFWFEQLKNLSGLRDAMNPIAAAKPK
jgi:hypothetical protein